MWMNKMLSISKAENGYVLECNVPLKPEKMKEGKDMMMCHQGSCEKQYIAKDQKEVASLVGKLMPMLDEDYKSEDEFDNAFGEAAKGQMKKDMPPEGKGMPANEKGKMKEDMPSKGKGAMKKEMY